MRICDGKNQSNQLINIQQIPQSIQIIQQNCVINGQNLVSFYPLLVTYTFLSPTSSISITPENYFLGQYSSIEYNFVSNPSDSKFNFASWVKFKWVWWKVSSKSRRHNTSKRPIEIIKGAKDKNTSDRKGTVKKGTNPV